MKVAQASLLFPFLLVSYEIANYLSNDMYLPALPEMMRDLNLSLQQVQLTLTTWFIGSAILPLFLGMFADRFGRRPILLWGGVVYIISTIVCAVTSDVSVLLTARFIEGAAIPTMMVAGYACIHELYEQKETIRILALMSSVMILAPAFGPLLGSFILLVTSWRGIFWYIAIHSAISIVLLWWYMPETLPKDSRKPIIFKTVVRQYLNMLMNKRFMFLMIVLGFIFTGFIVWITAGPLLVIDHLHYSPTVFGIAQAIIFIAYMIASYLVKYLIEIIGVHTLIKLGLMITLAGGIACILSALIFSQYLIPFVFAFTIYSVGSALCFAPLNRFIIESSDEPMGMRVSLFTVLWTLFAVLGSFIASIWYDGSIVSIALPIMLAISISCIMYLFIPSR